MVKSGASVKDLGEALEIGAGELIKTLMKLGEMVTITQSLSDDAIVILAEEFERQVEIEHAEEEKEGAEAFVDDPADLTPRAPVVTIMGHVDHGKTSLLDAIRETEVVKGEAGGITQHIGAYQVTHNEKKVTFLDTPGHEAFTAMRARGAKSTDIAVIVVAANDGVMPQTLEAISHAKAAEVPMVVAINKMDLPDANPDLVKKQLVRRRVWCPRRGAATRSWWRSRPSRRLNLDELMDMILLVAEVQELKANAKAPASGVVIEAQLDVGRGPVATVLVQRGTLQVGDAVVSGEAYGKVKAMFDFMGNALTKAGPSVPVQILGFNTLPAAGDFVMVVKDEREARQKAEQRTARLRQEQLAKSRGGASSLEEFYRRLKEGRVKELPLIIKGDVGGSVEALEEALRNITHPEVKVRGRLRRRGRHQRVRHHAGLGLQGRGHRLQRAALGGGQGSGRAGAGGRAHLPGHLQGHRGRRSRAGGHAGAGAGGGGAGHGGGAAGLPRLQASAPSPAATCRPARSSARPRCGWCATAASSTRAPSAR